MNFNDYQKQAKTTDVFTDKNIDNFNNPAFVTKILGLCGESGEVAEKFKKIFRDKNGIITEEDKKEIEKELGDVLWYLAIISNYLDIPFENVAINNLEKLASRKVRNQIHGSGDNR